MLPLGILASAGGAAGGTDFQLVSTTVLSSSASSVTFSGLGTSAAAFKHLQIRIVARDSQSGANSDLYLNFNGDSGSNYAWHLLGGTGSSMEAAGATSQPYIRLGASAGNGAGSNVFGSTIVDILNWASTSKNKTVRTLMGLNASGFLRNGHWTGLWMSTAATTSITVSCPGSYTLLAGTRVSLYGWVG